MEARFFRIVRIISVILFVWALLTLWVQYFGEIEPYTLKSDSNKTALIFFNPDPIYNLDEQICSAMAEELNNAGYNVQVSNSDDVDVTINSDLAVVCANTYNWAPDWETVDAVHRLNAGTKVIAITLGSGSTHRSHRMLLDEIGSTNARVIGERQLWLMRPNIDSRMEESNTIVACDEARQLIKECCQVSAH